MVLRAGNGSPVVIRPRLTSKSKGASNRSEGPRSELTPGKEWVRPRRQGRGLLTFQARHGADRSRSMPRCGFGRLSALPTGGDHVVPQGGGGPHRRWFQQGEGGCGDCLSRLLSRRCRLCGDPRPVSGRQVVRETWMQGSIESAAGTMRSSARASIPGPTESPRALQTKKPEFVGVAPGPGA